MVQRNKKTIGRSHGFSILSCFIKKHNKRQQLVPKVKCPKGFFVFYSIAAMNAEDVSLTVHHLLSIATMRSGGLHDGVQIFFSEFCSAASAGQNKSATRGAGFYKLTTVLSNGLKLGRNP